MYYIYCITNKLNHKSYVGQSINAEERWLDHISDAFRSPKLKTGPTKKFAIHHAIAKYGTDCFIWQVIDQCETIEEANELEEFYIAYLGTIAPNGYNLTSGGKNFRPSEETKKKLSKKLKVVGSFVGKKGADHPNFGTKQSEERKQRQSERLAGDGGPVKKIDSTTARAIYTDFLADQALKIEDLGTKYGLAKSAIFNILNKRSWKEALKDLPEVDLLERTRGEKLARSKLKEQDIIDIVSRYGEGNFTQQELADEYQITNSSICNIIKGKSWKHVKR